MSTQEQTPEHIVNVCFCQYCPPHEYDAKVRASLAAAIRKERERAEAIQEAAQSCAKDVGLILIEKDKRIVELEKALHKINDIRNSIIGSQTINWSEHIYPLVAALNEAGIEGLDYPEAKANIGTLIERATKAETENAALRKALEPLKLISEAEAYEMCQCYTCLQARIKDIFYHLGHAREVLKKTL